MISLLRRSTVDDSDRVRILQIVAVPFALRFLRGQAASMTDYGVDYLVVSSPGTDLEKFETEEGVPTYAVSISREISPLKDIVSIARLVRVIWQTSPNIVHTHNPKGGLLGQIAAFIVRIPIRVHTIHGLVYMTSTGWRRTLLMGSERLACRLATTVLCVSESVRQVAIDDSLVPAGKVMVPGNGSANGIDATGEFNPGNYDRVSLRRKFGVTEDQKVILFVGRLSHDKGLDDLAEAWGRVRVAEPESVLIVVGDVDGRDPASPGTLTTLANDRRVQLLGYREEIAELLAVADLFVLPTYREGFPTVLLEAAAMGVPIVSTDVPGCVDAIIDGSTGILVPPRTPDQLAEGICVLLTDRLYAAKLGESARARTLRSYSQEVVLSDISKVYLDRGAD